MISIVTPSFKSSSWLKLCIASVADQQGVDVEHIIQDAGSDDGTLDWLPNDPRVCAFVEKDSGMYDAINRGFRRATGDVMGWLNCDEQYLPGALAAVSAYFETHPEIDVLIADTVVTDAKGEYICHRYALKSSPNELWVRFSMLSCSLFVRRRVISELEIMIDTRWRVFGDQFWVMELLRRGLRFGVLRRFLSVFADTGENLALSPTAVAEQRIKAEMVPRTVRLMRPAILLFHKLRLLASGVYWQKPFDYSLYTLDSVGRRVTHQVAKPSGHWHGRG